MSVFKFRLQLEAMDERIVPDATPMTLEQSETLLVAKQVELKDLEVAVDVKAEALIQADAADDDAAV